MNQKEIFFRLNQYIAINRRLRLKEDALGHFKQAEFVKVYPHEKNYGEIPNNRICAPSTLSRLEQNKITAKTHVYDLLLAKLDAEFVLRESNNKTQDYLCQRVLNLFFCSTKDVDAVRLEINRYSVLFKRNCLWITDLQAIESLLNWFESDVVLGRRRFDELINQFEIFHPKLSHLLLYYLAYSSYFNPTLWPSIKIVKELIIKHDFNDEVLFAFQNFNERQQFKLIEVYYKNEARVHKESYLHQVFMKFKKVVIEASLHELIGDDVYLEILLNEFITNNSQFKKLIHRVYSAKKYNRNEARYLYLNFLIYEPFPYSIRKILHNRIYHKIKREDYRKEFLGWKKAN